MNFAVIMFVLSYYTGTGCRRRRSNRVEPKQPLSDTKYCISRNQVQCAVIDDRRPRYIHHIRCPEALDPILLFRLHHHWSVCHCSDCVKGTYLWPYGTISVLSSRQHPRLARCGWTSILRHSTNCMWILTSSMWSHIYTYIDITDILLNGQLLCRRHI